MDKVLLVGYFMHALLHFRYVTLELPNRQANGAKKSAMRPPARQTRDSNNAYSRNIKYFRVPIGRIGAGLALLNPHH